MVKLVTPTRFYPHQNGVNNRDLTGQVKGSAVAVNITKMNFDSKWGHLRHSLLSYSLRVNFVPHPPISIITFTCLESGTTQDIAR